MRLDANSVESNAEIESLVTHINSILCNEQVLQELNLVPMESPTALFQNCKNGVFLAKLVNAARSGMVNEKQIKRNPKNQMHVHENLNLCLAGASSAGCKLINVGAEDLLKEKRNLVLSLLSQLVKMALLDKVHVTRTPSLCQLVDSNIGETLEDVMNMPTEQLLIRWVNHHLDNAKKGEMQINNFGEDIKDGKVYIYLLSQLVPEIVKPEEIADDAERRYEATLSAIEQIGLERLIGPQDIANGDARLNLAFVAALFDCRSGLHVPSTSNMADIQLAHQELEQEVLQLKAMLASSEAQQQQSQTEGGDETLSTKAMEEIHDHYRSRIVTLESELEHAENANITERSRSDQLALECDDLSEEVGKFTMKLNTLTNRITEKNEEIHTIEKLYEESESTNQALKLDNEKLASEMVILRVHLEDAREQVELAKTQIKAQPVLKQPEPSEVSQAANSTEDSGMLAGSNTTDDKNTIESAESQTQAKGVSQIHVIDECNEAVRIASVTAVAQLLAMEEEYKGKLLAMESRFEKEKDALRRREVDLKQAVSTSQRETEKHQEYILKLKKEILDRTRLLEEHYRNKLDSDRRLKQANKSMQILLKSRDKGSMMKLQLQSLYTAFTKHERAATIIFKNLSATSVEQKKGLIQSGLIKRHVKGIAIPTYAVLIQNWLFLYRPEKKENPSTCLHIDTWHVSRMTVPGQHILTLQESDCTAVVQTLELVNQKTQEDWYVGILRASKWWATDDDNVAAILEKEKKKTAQSMQKMKVISLAEAQQTSRHVQSIAASAGAK